MANVVELLVRSFIADALNLSKNAAGGISEALRDLLVRTAGELNAMAQAHLVGDEVKVAEHRRNIEHLVGQCKLALATEIEAAVGSGGDIAVARILVTVLPLVARLGGLR